MFKFLKIASQSIAFILTLVLVLIGLPGFTTTARANNEFEPQPINEPSYVQLTSERSTATEVTLAAYADFPVSASTPMLLYRDDGPVAIQTATGPFAEWEAVKFTVTRPSAGFEKYYVTFGAQVSENVEVHDNYANELIVSFSAKNQVFTPEQGPPRLDWSTNRGLHANESIYIIHEETQEVVYSGGSYLSNGNYSLPRMSFESGPPRTYRAYIADAEPVALNFNELVNVKTKSSEIVLERAPWNVQLSITDESYTGDDELPILENKIYASRTEKYNKLGGDFR